VINPGKPHFKITGATIYVKPPTYHGKCPVNVTLIGRVQAKDGPGKVRSDLFLSFAGGTHVREQKMDDGDTLEQKVAVNRSRSGTAQFFVIGPNEQRAVVPVEIVCSHPRSHH
jgi:hypothetical protein